MAAKKISKTKKVTEIDEANVKIEVNEIEGEKEKEEEDTPEEETTEDSTEEENLKEEEVENFDEESGGRFSWKKVIIFTLIAAFIGAIIVGAYLYMQGQYKVTIVKVETKEKTIDIPEVTPTPTPAGVDREAYDITVKNGSGIEGEAASVQELLEDEGFKVSDIGNADNQAYLDTQILAGEDVDEEYVDELIEVLNERGPTEAELAPEGQIEEVIVIVGSELTKADATPTPLLE